MMERPRKFPVLSAGNERLEVERTIEQARNAPDLLKRVFIATSSLSRMQVEEEFADESQGHPPSPHFVQLYRFLTSNFSACVEVGVVAMLSAGPEKPGVYCQKDN